MLLDSVMLDAIEIDVEHSERVNTSVLSWPTGNPENPFRAIDVLWLNPSRSFRTIAAELAPDWQITHDFTAWRRTIKA